jgi:dolichyl-phosphate-mannose--protein O-mannosyl transferase
MYHYFPSVPFVTLSIGYSFLQIKNTPWFQKHQKSFGGLLLGYALIAFFLFLLFYPVLSGTPVSYEFVDKFLRWKDGWVFVIK